MRGLAPYKSIEQSIAGKQIGPVPEPLHFIEQLGCKVGLSDMDISPNRCVQKGLAALRNGVVRVQNKAVELILSIGGDELDE